MGIFDLFAVRLDLTKLRLEKTTIVFYDQNLNPKNCIFDQNLNPKNTIFDQILNSNTPL